MIHMPAKIIFTIALATTLAGCGLDVLEGKKSPEQVEHERREAEGLPPPVNLWAEPAPAEDPESAPVVVAAEPPCEEVFRQTSCVNGVATAWVW